MKRHSLLLPVLILLVFAAACSSNKNDDSKPQTIITSDSSDATGRLYVVTNYQSGGTVNGAAVKLFLSYDDLLHNIPLYTKLSDNNGNVDFGYVLKGNYYVTGAYGSVGVYRDTTVAQVLPQKSLTRYLYLK